MLPSIALLVPATASQRQWLLPCLCVGVAALTVTCVLLAAALAAPYRQAPLTEDRTPLRMANADATLNVAPGVAGYVDRLRQSAAQDGFRPGDPLIDLSGHTPGVAYVLGARPPGVAWLFGGYPGSEAYAALALGPRVDCDTLSRAWILLEPAGTARLPVELLERYGMDAQRDYRRSPPLHAPSDYEKFGAGTSTCSARCGRRPRAAPARSAAPRNLDLRRDCGKDAHRPMKPTGRERNARDFAQHQRRGPRLWLRAVPHGALRAPAAKPRAADGSATRSSSSTTAARTMHGRPSRSCARSIRRSRASV